MEYSLIKRWAVEAIGTGLLVAAVIGSGIMAERLASGNSAIALLANTIASGAALVALILAFGAISGAHFNPAVTLNQALLRQFPWREVLPYVAAQCLGGAAGAIIANVMFGLHWYSLSQRQRAGAHLLFSEFVATFALLLVIWGCQRAKQDLVAFAVGSYITAAYWFTASTSFANPAVTIARALSDSFAGIKPTDVLPFVVVQFAGAFAATTLQRWLPSANRAAPEQPIISREGLGELAE